MLLPVSETKHQVKGNTWERRGVCSQCQVIGRYDTSGGERTCQCCAPAAGKRASKILFICLRRKSPCIYFEWARRWRATCGEAGRAGRRRCRSGARRIPQRPPAPRRSRSPPPPPLALACRTHHTTPHRMRPTFLTSCCPRPRLSRPLACLLIALFLRYLHNM